MKLLRRNEGERIYRLSVAELQMFIVLLSHFPLLDLTDQKLTRSSDDPKLAEAQQFLEQAMAERRKEMRRELESWLKEAGRFTQADDIIEMRIAETEIEWLLQILNNVRVGAWHALGAPEETRELYRSGGEEAGRLLMLMEMAGQFQSEFL